MADRYLSDAVHAAALIARFAEMELERRNG